MKKIWFSVLASISIFFAGVFSVNAVTIDLIPDRSPLSVGESLDIELVISGLSADDLSTFDLNVVYDPGLLSFNGYTLGTQLGDLIVGDALDFSLGDTGGGIINLAEQSWLMDLSFQPDFFSLLVRDGKHGFDHPRLDRIDRRAGKLHDVYSGMKVRGAAVELILTVVVTQRERLVTGPEGPTDTFGRRSGARRRPRLRRSCNPRGGRETARDGSRRPAGPRDTRPARPRVAARRVLGAPSCRSVLLPA